MNYFQFKIEAPTFTAELALDTTTHKVSHASPLVEWLIGVDRFTLVRLSARRGWHLTQLLKLNHEKPKLRETRGDTFSSEHAGATPKLPREATADAD